MKLYFKYIILLRVSLISHQQIAERILYIDYVHVRLSVCPPLPACTFTYNYRRAEPIYTKTAIAVCKTVCSPHPIKIRRKPGLPEYLPAFVQPSGV